MSTSYADQYRCLLLVYCLLRITYVTSWVGEHHRYNVKVQQLHVHHALQHMHVMHCARCKVLNTAIFYLYTRKFLHMLASATIPAVRISVRFPGLQFFIVPFCRLCFSFFFHTILQCTKPSFRFLHAVLHWCLITKLKLSLPRHSPCQSWRSQFSVIRF